MSSLTTDDSPGTTNPEPIRTPPALPFVSVIVPVYNDAQRLHLCLQALETQTYPFDRHEVIVVDNGSDEDLTALVESSPKARLVTESTPGSYAARNRGIKASRGEVLAFTDSDCIPEPDWLEAGIHTLREYPDTAMIGGHIEIFTADPDRLTAAELHQSITGFRQQDYIEQKNFSATANLLARRWVFDQVGLFDATLMSTGDKKWGRRVHAHGLKQRYCAQARVRHPARRTIRDLLSKMHRICGGEYEAIQRREAQLLAWIWRRLRWSVLGPFRHASHPLMDTAVARFQFIAVESAVLTGSYLEMLRLYLGGRPRRK